jgi:hypothetical protein
MSEPEVISIAADPPPIVTGPQLTVATTKAPDYRPFLLVISICMVIMAVIEIYGFIRSVAADTENRSQTHQQVFLPSSP